MTEGKQNTNEYLTNVRVLIVLLLLSATNIITATVHHGTWSAGIIVMVAGIQAFIMLTWFMHLKWDNILFRILTGAVFILYVMVIILLFFDYKFR
jgi:cytochrome c oxidase subunit IV